MLARYSVRQSQKAARLLSRKFASQIPGRGPWLSLSESERAAWEALGWNADRWEGRQTPPSLQNWQKLSAAQKSAAIHGLGLSFETWEALVGAQNEQQAPAVQKMERPQPKSVQADPTLFTTPVNQKPTTAKDVASTIAQAAWNIAKTVLAPDTAVSSVSESDSPAIVVNDVETTLYLDDSPSMNLWTSILSFTPRLDEGKRVLRKLVPALGLLPCRVVKFSGVPTVLSPRREDGVNLPAVDTGWDCSGQGTYLWHMIQEDVMKRYRPGRGKLRLVVVTDGEDNMSPSEYQGMRGMDPMMRTLNKAGYDIEWHIIVIGGERGLDRYKALAGATGGSFLEVKRQFDPNSSDTKALLKAIQNSTDERGRRERQRRYKEEVSAGKVENVDWFKQLPPGDGKK